MADLVKRSWKERYLSARKRASAAAAKGKEVGTKGLLVTGEAVLASGGGLLAAELNSRYPSLRGQNTITLPTILGLVTSLGGAVITVTAKDKDSVIAGGMAGALGNGMLAGDIAVKRFIALQKAK